jgi:hypothetical protein
MSGIIHLNCHRQFIGDKLLNVFFIQIVLGGREFVIPEIASNIHLHICQRREFNLKILEPKIFVLEVIFNGPFAGVSFCLLSTLIVELAFDNLLVEMTVGHRELLFFMHNLITLSSLSSLGREFT